MSNWQAIIFDLDDTLYPERNYVLSGFQAVAAWAETCLAIPAEQGLAELSQLFQRGVRGDTFNHWLQQHGRADETLVQELIRVYREHQPVLAPFPDTPAILAQLRRRYRLGLVSDGYLAVQQRKWTALGLAAHFETIIFSDEWGRAAWKPSVIPFLAALKKLRIQADRAAYIGDNPAKDFLGARELGMFTVRVRQPGGEYAHLDPPTAEHAPHVTVESLTEVKRLFPR